ncbi:MAG: hypothetical protein K0R10_773 [Alphaproteobacteria bacterium]|nr:hypothetical protein [Alphaproteobacteria bacterium]
MTYFLTPEFHHQLWSKCPPYKLVAAPVLLLLLWGISYGDLGIGLPGPVALRIGSLYTFLIVVLIWGSYEASIAMDEEIKSRTWDHQRVSAISPAQLAFGKLFGSTSYTWYVGLMCIVAYFSTFDHAQRPLVYAAFFMLASGLFAHFIAFLLSLSSFAARARHGAVTGQGAGFFPCIAAIMCSFWINENLRQRAVNAHVSPDVERRLFPDFSWYGHDYDAFAFAAVAVTFFLFWGILACYRVIRAELRYRVWPWVWMIFIPSLSIFLAGCYVRTRGGMVDGADAAEKFQSVDAIPPFLCAFLVSFLLGYATLLSESSDRRKYLRLGAALRARKWAHAFENTPLWMATLPYVLLFGAGLLYNCLQAAPLRLAEYGPAAAGAFLFAARDGFAVHTLYNILRRRAAYAVPLYFLVMYGVAPLAFAALSGDIAANTRALMNYLDVGAVKEVFYPHRSSEWLRVLAMPMLQALLAALLFIRFAMKSDDSYPKAPT